MRGALIGIGLGAVVVGLAVLLARSVPQEAPERAEADVDDAGHKRLSEFPGPRCRAVDAPTALRKAAGLLASTPAGEHGVRQGDGVWVVPRALLDVGHGHGVRFGYAEEDHRPYGLRIHGVERGSVGDALGLQADDVVGEVGAEVIASTDHVAHAVDALREQGSACVRVLRDRRWRDRWYVIEDTVPGAAP